MLIIFPVRQPRHPDVATKTRRQIDVDGSGCVRMSAPAPRQLQAGILSVIEPAVTVVEEFRR